MPSRLAVISALLLRAALPLPAASVPDQQSIQVGVEARSIQPGELVVLTMTMLGDAERVHVRALTREIQAFTVDRRTWRALLGIDLSVAPGTYPVAIEARSGTKTIRTTYALKVQPRRFATRTLTVDEAFVNPPAALLTRITQEAAELRRLWKQSSAERLWTGPFLRPVPGAANSVFGTRSIFNGRPRDQHGGADFLSPAGTPIHAPGAGRVVLARDLYFTGNTILIDHGLGLFSVLAHLSAIDVHAGATVSAGEVVGEAGATGRVTGPNVHSAVRVSASRVDPVSVLALLGAETG